MALLAVLLPPVSGSAPVWLVLVVLFLGGTAIAPSMAGNFAQVSGAVPPERRAEAFGWLATAGTGGAALSMPLTGVLLDSFGPAASVAVGAVLALAAMVLSLVGSSRSELVPAET
jgi:predicted MFS family arabinose efflux permease